MSMSNITPLRAQQYAALPERGTRITDVQKELKAVIYGAIISSASMYMALIR